MVPTFPQTNPSFTYTVKTTNLRAQAWQAHVPKSKNGRLEGRQRIRINTIPQNIHKWVSPQHVVASEAGGETDPYVARRVQEWGVNVLQEPPSAQAWQCARHQWTVSVPHYEIFAWEVLLSARKLLLSGVPNGDKTHQISKLKCFSSHLVAVFTQSIEAMC